MKTKLPSALVLLLLGGAAFGSGCGQIEIGTGAAGETPMSTGANNAEAGGSSAMVGRGGVAGRIASGGLAGTIASGGAAGMTASGGVAGTIANGGVAGTIANGGVAGTIANGGVAGTIANGGVAGMGASGGVAGMGASGGVAGMGASGGVAGMAEDGGVAGMADNGGVAGAAGAAPELSCAPPRNDTWLGCHVGQPCFVCVDSIADYPFYTWHHPQCKRADACTFREQGACSSDCPPPGGADRCDGTPGNWDGCRGTGCYVCTELVADYPNYFVNHPYCFSNGTCDGQHYTCNAVCPAPGAADK